MYLLSDYYILVLLFVYQDQIDMNNNNNIIEVKFVAFIQKVRTWTVKIMKHL